MPCEVEVHALSKAVYAQEGLEHADDFSPFFVDGRGVEISDFLVLGRSNGVGHGACIFRELMGPKRAHIVDTLDCSGTGSLGCRQAMGQHVGGEFLVSEHRQALFEGQLKPVTTGDAITRPVVEILVTNHGLDQFVVAVGSGLRIGQNIFGVEQVKALVLHGTGVKVGHGDDHEAL